MKRIFGLLALAFALSSCAAMQVAIEHKDLEVQNKMSDSIILPPVPPSERTVFIEYRNTSDQNFDLNACLRSMVAANGSQIVNNPRAAKYLLQVRTLSVGKTEVSAAQRTLINGYGGALTGGAAGALIGASSGSLYNVGIGGSLGALAGGLIETAVNSAVKDTTYGVITDVQISVKTNGPVQQTQNASIKQGTSSMLRQSRSSSSNREIYRTRVLSTADKVNLDLSEALPKLEEGTCRSIAGII